MDDTILMFVKWMRAGGEAVFSVMSGHHTLSRY